MKYLNIKRYKFSTIFKKIDFIRNNFYKFLRLIDIRKINLNKLAKLSHIRRYIIGRIYQIKFKKIQYTFIYFSGFFILLVFVYLIIPSFYNYEKSKIIKVICLDQKIKCSIQGDIKYSFYPTPRLKIYDLIIKDLDKGKNITAKIEKTEVKISAKDLLNQESQNFKKIIFNNFEIDLNIKKYLNLLSKKITHIPLEFRNGKITLTDKKKYIATINDTNFIINQEKDSSKFKLKGDFLNDELFILLESNIINNNEENFDLIIKMSELNFLSKLNFSHFKNNEKPISGNILIKKDKNKITSAFEYIDNKMIIKKSNLKNTLIDGQLEGEIVFSPFFSFNLDADLNSINFTKLYSKFLSLNEEDRKKIFLINDKINGELNLSSRKIYSNYNLVKSFESSLTIRNGTISIERFLLNLGKLGAADFLGEIRKKNKYTNFKFESNIFVDNQKKFLSKFGIYNKKTIPSSMFVSGNFDLDNLKFSIYEISDTKKLENEDVNYIENEFNQIMLEDGYKSLFYFPNFKEFISRINDEAE